MHLIYVYCEINLWASLFRNGNRFAGALLFWRMTSHLCHPLYVTAVISELSSIYGAGQFTRRGGLISCGPNARNLPARMCLMDEGVVLPARRARRSAPASHRDSAHPLG
jgi:hypothetical protein